MDKIINSLMITVDKLQQPVSSSPPYLKNRIKEIEDVIKELSVICKYDNFKNTYTSKEMNLIVDARIKEIEKVRQELKTINNPKLTDNLLGVKVYRDSISHPINRIESGDYYGV